MQLLIVLLGLCGTGQLHGLCLPLTHHHLLWSSILVDQQPGPVQQNILLLHTNTRVLAGVCGCHIGIHRGISGKGSCRWVPKP